MPEIHCLILGGPAIASRDFPENIAGAKPSPLFAHIFGPVGITGQGGESECKHGITYTKKEDFVNAIQGDRNETMEHLRPKFRSGNEESSETAQAPFPCTDLNIRKSGSRAVGQLSQLGRFGSG
jgi:hypothetical protein